MSEPSAPPSAAPEARPRKPFYLELHWQILFAMGLGILVGAVALYLDRQAMVPGGEEVTQNREFVVSAFGWLGTLIFRLLRMIIVPLVLTSIIAGVSSVGRAGLGRLFSKTLGYYLLSSALAIFVGLAAVNLILPGERARDQITSAERAELPDLTTAGSPADLLIDMVPENVVRAASTPDMLSLIFFAIVFGIAITAVGERHQQILIGFFNAAFEAMMTLTGWVIKLLPIGVFGLLAREVATTGFERFQALALYMVTIAVSLSVHLLITLPLLLLLLGKIKPWIHFANMSEALTTAFSSASSAATLPVTLRAVEKRVGVSNRVSSFVLPMGATVNMDGTALYECAGALFIAQVLGFDLSLGQQAIVVLTALLASIGAAAVPSAGLVVIFIVLDAVGLRGPQVDAIVGAMLAIDRPLDMFRTSVNVFSDSCGAAIIARSEGEAEVDAEIRPPL